jgi:hypothetical protein
MKSRPSDVLASDLSSDEVPAEITIDLTQLRPLEEYR